MSSSLAIKSADLYYGAAQALYGVTLECKPSRITAVLGRNGVGKSSTLRAVTGINNVAAGEILFDKETISLVTTKGEPVVTNDGGQTWRTADRPGQPVVTFDHGKTWCTPRPATRRTTTATTSRR